MSIPDLDLGAFERSAVHRMAKLRSIGAYGTALRVAAHHGVTLADVLGKGRLPKVTRARHDLMALLRWSTSLSYPEIGALFDRDHSTVIAAVKKRERELALEHAVAC